MVTADSRFAVIRPTTTVLSLQERVSSANIPAPIPL